MIYLFNYNHRYVVMKKNRINLISVKNLLLRIFFISPFFLSANYVFALSLELSLYGGFNNAAHSSVNFYNATNSYGVTDGKYSTDGWKAESFKSPIYYGYRLSFTKDDFSNIEFALDFNHSKVKAKTIPAGLKRLEFTDGINTLTANVLYKLENVSLSNFELEPYFGLGLGIAYPHVDVEGTNSKTYDYQYTGEAYQIMLGSKHQIADSWKIFAEYRVTYTPIEADLDGGGKIETDILNNQVSLGISYLF